MKIAFATFADLPNPPTKGGAVEALIDDICIENEKDNALSIDIYSIYDKAAEALSCRYKNTAFHFYHKQTYGKWTFKNIVAKLFHIYLPDRNMNKIISMINQQNYDFVIVTSINRELKYVFSKINAKVIWYLHGDPFSALTEKQISDVLKNADGVIAVSEFIKGRVANITGVPDIKVVLNCTDIVPLHGEGETIARNKIREKYSIGENDVLFTYVGRITPIKGILETVKAYVSADIPSSRLMIVGAPSGREQEFYYEALKAESNKKVVFPGYIPHDALSEIYAATDVVVVPSLCYESALLTGIEALLCRRKVITTNMGGIPEYTSGKNACLLEVDEHFEKALKEAMIVFSKQNYQEDGFDVKKFSQKAFYKNFCKAIRELREN